MEPESILNDISKIKKDLMEKLKNSVHENEFLVESVNSSMNNLQSIYRNVAGARILNDRSFEVLVSNNEGIQCLLRTMKNIVEQAWSVAANLEDLAGHEDKKVDSTNLNNPQNGSEEHALMVQENQRGIIELINWSGKLEVFMGHTFIQVLEMRKIIGFNL
jgi:hypothetical protein